MKTLKIDGVKYSIPERWGEMPFSQWYAYQKSNDKLLSVSILTGVPKDILSQMEYSFVIKLYSQFTWMDTLPESICKQFIFEGVTYHYDNDFKKITAGQFVDLEEKIKEFAEDPIGAYPGLIAILYKSGDKYDWEQTPVNEERFKALPMDLVIPIKNFFLFREKSFWTVSQLYSQIQAFRTPIKHRGNNLQKSGGTLTRFINYVKRTVGLSNTSKTLV